MRHDLADKPETLGADLRALRKNSVGGLSSLVWKNLSKIGQFRRRD